ncbi:MAG: BrnA antitoxin family protein [Chloroflexota bacterium]|nr:BrnA antitoxin family protein [Chloroflexota bacterium]
MKREKADPELRARPRLAETVEITMPQDALGVLKQLAERRDMSYQALIRFYISQGLRQDLSSSFNDHILESAAEVLARHLTSAEEVENILGEIRDVNRAKWHPWVMTRQQADRVTNNGHTDEED